MEQSQLQLTPVGTFEIVGREGAKYDNVDLDHGTMRANEAEARQAAAQYHTGMVVDGWFDPRSGNDPVFFPLSITDPAADAAEQRAQRNLLGSIGGGLFGVSLLGLVLLFRRGAV